MMYGTKEMFEKFFYRYVNLCNDQYTFVPKAKKKICVFPVDRPTLTFFMPKKKNRLANSGNSSPFPCLFPTSTIFFISLYI